MLCWTGGELRVLMMFAREESSGSPLCPHRRRAQSPLDVCTGGELRVPLMSAQEESSGSPQCPHRRRAQVSYSPSGSQKYSDTPMRRDLLHVFNFFGATHLSHLSHQIFLLLLAVANSLSTGPIRSSVLPPHHGPMPH